VHHQLDSNPARRLRMLLRKLRDLNLTVRRLAVAKDSWVRLSGCLSVDRPIESGVSYRLTSDTGAEYTLELLPGETELIVNLAGSDRSHSIAVPFELEAEGILRSDELAARVDATTVERRDLEHFMRRIVRTVCSRQAA